MRYALVLLVLFSSCALRGEVTGLRQRTVYGHHLKGSRFGAVKQTVHQVQVNDRHWCDIPEDRYNIILLGDSISC